MVRLVFRPYTQVRRSICTSESLRASTRVSPGFTLLRHSSPSFGYQHICSNSNLSPRRFMIGRQCHPCKQRFPTSGSQAALYFHFALGFPHPNTCIHVRLLGPCFKTGRIAPFRQSPERQQVTTDLNRSTRSLTQQAIKANSQTRVPQTRKHIVGTSVPTTTTSHQDITATEVTYLPSNHFPQYTN